MLSRWWSIVRWARFGALVLGLSACDCGGDAPGEMCTSSADCVEGARCTDGRCTEEPTDDASLPSEGGTVLDASVIGISVLPSTTTLDVTIGEPSGALSFTVSAQVEGGGVMSVGDAAFTVDNVSPGVIGSDGRYFANGTIGGEVTVTASVPSVNGTFTASATVHIRLVATLGAGDGPQSPGVIFAQTAAVSDASAEAEILYPLDGAVMPQNVQPADLQWACGAASVPCPEADTFRVTITKPNLLVTQYVSNAAVAANDHALPSGLVWRAVAQTDAASSASIRVDRFDAAGARVIVGEPVSVRFAQAAITGTVYYWDIDDRTIRFIEDSSSASEVLLPHIDSPVGPGDGDDCVGCHAISPSGRYMLANTNFANYGALFDLTRADLSTATPTPTEWPSAASVRWRLASWSPGEDRAMVSTASGTDRLALIDPMSGATIQALDAGGANLALPNPGTMPAWAPNDSSIAFVADANAWAGATTTGNLALLPKLASGVDRFGTVVSLVQSSALAGRPEVAASGNHGVFYPTWSPSSAWLAFAHGTSSRSDPRDAAGGWSAGDFAHTSSLYLVRPDGTGLRRLDRGCLPTPPERRDAGVIGDAGRVGLDFQPNFAPFEGGGYVWLSFLSRRPYGNSISGNRGSAIQPGQIWVMAIRVNADGTMDPSEVAYWLPGQAPSHRTVSAYWAPRACRANGEGCNVGSECCGGDCRPPVGSNVAVCSPPPPEQCRQIHQTCASVSDCCGAATDPSITCTGNVCERVIVID